MRKTVFVPGEYYHIYSRVLFNAPEFRNDQNAKRLLQAFTLANSTRSSEAFQYLKDNKDAVLEKAVEIAKRGEKLVDILCYVIMPDHYHLLLRERSKKGISNFIHKCNISIAKYINIKNKRRGPLFESRFNAKHINTNEYLLHLSLYIHLNPLDFLIGREWRANKLKNWSLAKKKLINYPWSSIKTFLNDNCKNQVLSNTEILTQQFNAKKDYEIFLQEWSEESSAKIADILETGFRGEISQTGQGSDAVAS
jgi:putative transposase